MNGDENEENWTLPGEDVGSALQYAAQNRN